MPRFRPLAAVAVVSAAVLLVSACAHPTGTGAGNPGGPGGSDAFAPAVAAAGEDCRSYGPTPPPQPVLAPLPADAVLALATRCVFRPKTVPGDGEWIVRDDQRAEHGLDALAAALRLPSEQRPADAICNDIGYIPIIITVTDKTGRQFVPEIPHTACGAPLPATVNAINALPWVTVLTTPVRQSRTELEVTSGCSGAMKPVIAITGLTATSSPRVSPVDTTAHTFHVCRYDIAPDPAMTLTLGESGATVHGGKLVAASTLDGQAAHDLLAAVAAAKPADGTCTRQEAPFADIWRPQAGPHITVELGGCYRVLVDTENYLRQLDAATVTRLLGR